MSAGMWMVSAVHPREKGARKMERRRILVVARSIGDAERKARDKRPEFFMGEPAVIVTNIDSDTYTLMPDRIDRIVL